LIHDKANDKGEKVGIQSVKETKIGIMKNETKLVGSSTIEQQNSQYCFKLNE
jgi:hypothetical protein